MKTSTLNVGGADWWYIAPMGTRIPQMNVKDGRFSDAWPSAWVPFASAADTTIEAERQGDAFGITVLRMYPITVPGRLWRYGDFMLGHETARLDTRYLFDRCRVDPHRPDTVLIVNGNWGFYVAGETPKWTGYTVVDYFRYQGKKGIGV